MPITFRPLKYIERDILARIMTRYTSDTKYVVRRIVAEGSMGFLLELVPLNPPYMKIWEPMDSETFEQYSTALPEGLSFGAYDAGHLVGFVLAEARHWNRTLWINEFHIAESHRGSGIGRGLMERVIEEGKLRGLRVVGCETQTTNVPAIRFYRKMGFTLDGIDLSLYSNEDWPDGEIALFMKRKLDGLQG